jgi:hypothetical protein
MAQASGGEHPAGRLALRTIALIVGLIGAILALIINVLYSVVHVLTQAAGVAHDTGHFFLGLVVVLVGTVGAFLAPILPILAAVMLVIAGIGFFFIVGWWAFIASPFFLVAAVLTFSNRRVDLPGVA